MTDSDREQSRIDNNRLAAAVVAGSLVVAALAAVLYRAGWIEYLVPAHGPAADAVPLYFLIVVALLALVVWSWNRLFSWFQ